MEPHLCRKRDPDVFHFAFFAALEDKLDQDEQGLHALCIWNHPKLVDEGLDQVLQIIEVWDITTVFQDHFKSFQAILKQRNLILFQRHRGPHKNMAHEMGLRGEELIILVLPVVQILKDLLLNLVGLCEELVHLLALDYFVDTVTLAAVLLPVVFELIFEVIVLETA